LGEFAKPGAKYKSTVKIPANEAVILKGYCKTVSSGAGKPCD
jgi:hypothetical protein